MAALSSPTPGTGARTALLPSSSTGLGSASSRASPPEWLHRGAGRVDLVRMDYLHKRARSPTPTPLSPPRAKAPRLGPGSVASAIAQTPQPPRTPSPSPRHHAGRATRPRPRPLTPHPASSHCSHPTARRRSTQRSPPSSGESLSPSSPPWLDDSLEVARGWDDGDDETDDGGDDTSNPFVAASLDSQYLHPPSPPLLPALRADASSPALRVLLATNTSYPAHADVYPAQQPMHAENAWYANAGDAEYPDGGEYDNDSDGGRPVETHYANHHPYDPTRDDKYPHYPAEHGTTDGSSDGVAWGRDPWGFYTTQRLLRGRAAVAWQESNERTRVHEPVVSPISFSPSPSPPLRQSRKSTPSPSPVCSPPHVSPRYTPPRRPRRTSTRPIWRGERVIEATRGGARIPDPRDVDDDDDEDDEGSDDGGRSHDRRDVTHAPTPQLSPTRRAARDARLAHFAVVDAYALHVEIVL